VSDERKDIGRALKSIGDDYIEARPADIVAVRAGVDRYRRRRGRLAAGGAVLATGTTALLVYFATTLGAPDGTLPPADGPGLAIVEEHRVVGSPLQVAAKQDVAWVTRLADGVISRIEVGASSPSWERDVGTIPADIQATGDGLWIADRATNQIVQIDPETGARLQAWQLQGPPGRITVGEKAIRTTVDGIGVVRIDRATDEQRTIYEGSVIDIAMGQTAFWVMDERGRIAAIDPDSGDPVDGLERFTVIGDGEITYLREALYYGIEGNRMLLRIDEATATVTDRIQLPEAYQDIDADSNGLWVLVRDGRLGRLAELDPATGAVLDRSLDLVDDPVDIVTGEDGVWVALASGGKVVLVR